MISPATVREWVEARPESGQYVFTRADVGAVTNASDAAIKMTLYRLKLAGAIVSPRRDFFVLVPREYRAAGCPPASWFIDDLMRHLGRRYYVALLSAAALHGAGHQQPMAVQVMVDSAERGIEVGRVRIDFHVSKRIATAATETLQTETGSLEVSTPETTALDLVRFPAAAGYWSNVATVLSELAEKLDPKLLVAAASQAPQSDVQRLGWLLDRVERPELAETLLATLVGKRVQPTPLNSAREPRNASLDARWRVLVNDDVEPDL